MTANSRYNPTALAPSAQSTMVPAGDTRLHCIEAGVGRPLVLVGGWPQSVHCWRRVFTKLAERYRVIAIDPPGLGDSAKPAPRYDIEGVARTMWACLDTLGLNKVDFVGFDIGMWIGYPLAKQAPQRLRTLTLIDARIPGLVPMPPFNPAAAVVSWHFAFNMLPELPELLIDGREHEFLRWLFTSRTPTPGVFTEADFAEYARVYRGRAAITSAVGYYRAMPESMKQVEALAQSAKLTMPLLAIAGGRGVGQPMIDSMDRIATNVRGLVFENCGHYVPEEAPERLVEVLTEFLGQHQ
jgi:pimeloyl-ACP methyl ester carboxylesterase